MWSVELCILFFKNMQTFTLWICSDRGMEADMKVPIKYMCLFLLVAFVCINAGVGSENPFSLIVCQKPAYTKISTLAHYSIFDGNNHLNSISGITIDQERYPFDAGGQKVTTITLDLDKGHIGYSLVTPLAVKIHPVDRDTSNILVQDVFGNFHTKGLFQVLEYAWTDTQHRTSFEKYHPYLKVVLHASKDNHVFLNASSVRWYQGAFYGPCNGDWETRSYSCLLVYKDNTVCISDVDFHKTTENDMRILLKKEDITDKVVLAVGGYSLLDDHGTFTGLAGCVESFDDLRHIFQCALITHSDDSSISKDLAGGGIFFPMGQLQNNNRQLSYQALQGPVLLDCVVSPNILLFPKLLREKLNALGYSEKTTKAQVTQRGNYYFQRNKIYIFIKLSPYPHTVLGITQDGKLISIVMSGKSSRLGPTIEEAAKIAQQKGLVSAIIFVSGGDSDVSIREGDHFKAIHSSPHGRERALGSLIFAVRKNQRLGEGDLSRDIQESL